MATDIMHWSRVEFSVWPRSRWRWRLLRPAL